MSSGETGHLTKVSHQLSGGLVALVGSTSTVYLPPGWIHATYTTKPGSLVGINFTSLESLPMMAESLEINSKYIFQLPGSFRDNFEEYQNAVGSFLDDEYDLQLISQVASSWVALHHTLQTTVEF